MKKITSLLASVVIVSSALFTGCKSCDDCKSASTAKAACCGDKCAGACKEAKCEKCECK